MNKSKVVTISISAVAVIAVLFFVFVIAKKRYFSGDFKRTETQNVEKPLQPDREAGNSNDLDQESTVPENVPSSAEETAPNITKSDCSDDCKKFKDNADDYKYCQQICGDIPVSTKNSEEDCSGLSGREKDYCWRDLAVSKKDFSYCQKVSDEKLKSACRNRVAEEIFN